MNVCMRGLNRNKLPSPCKVDPQERAHKGVSSTYKEGQQVAQARIALEQHLNATLFKDACYYLHGWKAVALAPAQLGLGTPEPRVRDA